MSQPCRQIRVLALSFLCGAACLTLEPAVVMAQKADQRSQLLVSPAWLALHVNDPNLVLLQVGDAEEYMNEHLPNARFASLRSISKPDTHEDNSLHLEMLSAEGLRTALEKLGISDDSKVVVYYGNDWVTPSTRVVFTLDYAGLGSRVVLLDGGMQAWKKNGGKLTDAV
jgi:thiosulfate/3-mercaptopyruvate sulfurtransferase